MLYGAKDFILMSNMFATCDESVMPIVDLLESKIKEGIPVHMIVERVFAIKYSGCLKKLKKIGVNLFYNDNMIKLKNRLVYHDKFCVVDNKKALVYGANLFDSEIDSTGFNHMFRDSGIALSGPVVTDLALAWMSLAFQLKDKKAQKDLLEIKSKIDKQFVAETKIGSRGLGQIQKKNDLNGTCRVVIQSPATKLNAMGMLYAKLVEKAQKSVYVSLPRLPYTLENDTDPLTGDVLKNLLRKSQENGDFQVDIMTNNKMVSTDVKSKNFKKTGVLTSLYKFFVKMEDTIKVVNSSREYFGGKNKRDNFNVWNYFQFTHGKTLMIDNAVYVVGSYNLNETSNNTSFEMGVLCYDRELVEEAQNSMILDMINSVPILE